MRPCCPKDFGSVRAVAMVRPVQWGPPWPWSSRRLGSAPYANNCRTVSLCPQYAAAHSGVPSEPGPLLSVSGEAPASMSERAISASPCTEARYSGVVPSLFLPSGLAPLRNRAFVPLASPARTAPKRRRESFFCWRCFIAGEASDHGGAGATHIHSLITAISTVTSQEVAQPERLVVGMGDHRHHTPHSVRQAASVADAGRLRCSQV